MTQVLPHYTPYAPAQRPSAARSVYNMLRYRYLRLARTPDLPWRIMRLAMVSIALASVGLAAWHRAEFCDWMDQINDHPVLHAIFLLTLAMAAFNGGIFIWQVVLAIKYRPHAAVSDELLPVITVIVPAYNEGRCVMDTLQSLAASDYPADKLEIIAVDDGSRDDTWQWMQKAEEALAGRVVLHRQPRNMGKRHALHVGFTRGRGSVMVTVDSDSIVERDTLRRLVSPFVHDANIGGVAGNVRVLNRTEGLLPRMLEVSFCYSFDFIRAAQSMTDTVFCTPGALSAYRADVVRKVLPEWTTQHFCGRAANIGEDRAMTNLILREGLKVTFQRDSVVFTKVPTAYKGLCKMFIRWGRSNVRENLAMAKFAFGPFRAGNVLGARLLLVQALARMVLPSLMLLLAFGMLLANPMVFGSQMFAGSMLMALLPAGFYVMRHRSSEGLWAIGYSLLWMTGLWWIGTWSLLTVHRSGWLTRDLPGQRQDGLVGGETARAALAASAVPVSPAMASATSLPLAASGLEVCI